MFESRGRVGTSIGSHNLKNFSTIAEADKVFRGIFLEKTGNEFGVANFTKKAGKYYKVEVDIVPLSQEIKPNSVPTKLSEPLYELMKLLFTGKVMKSTLLEFCLDLDAMPLGRITKAHVQEAMNLLGDLSVILDQENSNRQIIAATNQFYSYFPHDFGLRSGKRCTWDSFKFYLPSEILILDNFLPWSMMGFFGRS